MADSPSKDAVKEPLPHLDGLVGSNNPPDVGIHTDAKALDQNLAASIWSNFSVEFRRPLSPQAVTTAVYDVAPPSSLPLAPSSELAFMQHLGAVRTQSEIDEAKHQIETVAQDPGRAIVTAAQTNRVVGIGDIHGPLGPQMSLLTQDMPALRSAGITHLAVEIPSDYQRQINDWSSADQSFLRAHLKDRSSLLSVIDAAKAAGISIVAVDKLYDPREVQYTGRDTTFADNIQAILKTPDSKVLFLAGAQHLQDDRRSTYATSPSVDRNREGLSPRIYNQGDTTPVESAVHLLREAGISVETFYPQISSSADSLMPITRDLETTVSVKTTAAPAIGVMKNVDGTNYYKWDNVIMFPPGAFMADVQSELSHFGKEASDILPASLSHNQIILLGEMGRAEPEQDISPHRAFIGSMMTRLKASGLTDIAIDLPSMYQSTLDEFVSSGNVSPLPGSYDKSDFWQVLSAAKREGINLRAIGLPHESLLTVEQRSDGYSRALAAMAQPNHKILFWCDEGNLVSFRDDAGTKQGLSTELAKRNIQSDSFATITQDFYRPSIGLVTEIISNPTAFAPAQTRYLKDLPDTIDIPLERFDNVIIYPSPSRNS